MKGWWKYVACVALGAALCFGAVMLATRGAGAKLNAELASLRTSLASATAHSAELAEQLRLIHVQLDDANRRADSEQRIIAGQQQLIDAGKRGLEGIAAQIAGSGSDIGKQVHALSEGFIRLYRIYHPGAK
jgi:chromosome segregation ATPase